MGLPTYECEPCFPAAVPEMMRRHGIAVTPEPLCAVPEPEDFEMFGQIYRYRLCRGPATVELMSFPRNTATLRFALTCGDSPFWWWADMKLLRRVKGIVLAHGARERSSDGSDT